MNTKSVILILLPCIVALVSCAYFPGYYPTAQYGYYPSAQYGYPTGNIGAAAGSLEAVRQAKLFNYLLGGLFFLNLFNVTGNRIAG